MLQRYPAKPVSTGMARFCAKSVSRACTPRYTIHCCNMQSERTCREAGCGGLASHHDGPMPSYVNIWKILRNVHFPCRRISREQGAFNASLFRDESHFGFSRVCLFARQCVVDSLHYVTRRHSLPSEREALQHYRLVFIAPPTHLLNDFGIHDWECPVRLFRGRRNEGKEENWGLQALRPPTHCRWSVMVTGKTWQGKAQATLTSLVANARSFTQVIFRISKFMPCLFSPTKGKEARASEHLFHLRNVFKAHLFLP